MSYADIFQPAKTLPAWAYNVGLVFTASLLIALSAQVSLILPFSPVPVTLQTLAVLLSAALLGKHRGLAAVSLYLFQGAAGLPVFAGGKAGLAVLLGPTGGYLLGFAAAAFTVGYLIDYGWDQSFLKAVLALLIGSAVIYLSGLAWLTEFVGIERILHLGLYPFLIGDLLKLTAAAVFLSGSGKFKPRSIR